MNLTIDFFLMASRLAPVNKRMVIHLAWLQCFVTPLNTLNDAVFGVYFPDVKARAKRTGQKILMEYSLNIVFNPGNPRKITIDNSGDNIGVNFFYNSNEGYPAQTFYNEAEGETPFYFNNELEYEGGTDFVVYVPTEVLSNYSEAQVKNEVDKYRPAGTSFTIITY